MAANNTRIAQVLKNKLISLPYKFFFKPRNNSINSIKAGDIVFVYLSETNIKNIRDNIQKYYTGNVEYNYNSRGHKYVSRINGIRQNNNYNGYNYGGIGSNNNSSLPILAGIVTEVRNKNYVIEILETKYDRHNDLKGNRVLLRQEPTQGIYIYKISEQLIKNQRQILNARMSEQVGRQAGVDGVASIMHTHVLPYLISKETLRKHGMNVTDNGNLNRTGGRRKTKRKNKRRNKRKNNKTLKK